MTLLVPSRRGFLGGLGGLLGLVAAPAIVRAANLMPISVFKPQLRWASSAGMAMGWYRCDGGLLRCADYPELFAVIGKTYGGDGVMTFAVPDARAFVVDSAPSFVHPSWNPSERTLIQAINANGAGHPPGQIIHQMGRPNARIYGDTQIDSSFFSGYEQWPVKDGRQFQPPADMLKHFNSIKST